MTRDVPSCKAKASAPSFSVNGFYRYLIWGAGFNILRRRSSGIWFSPGQKGSGWGFKGVINTTGIQIVKGAGSRDSDNDIKHRFGLFIHQQRQKYILIFELEVIHNTPG